MAGEYGKYRLLRRLAVGGMAEVFLAEVRGEGGFRKFVAIKRILPHLSKEEEFISMFFDEARLMARFNHPNIVQIYDLGRVGKTYFLAMEFVKGLTMFRIINRCAKMHRRIPLPIVARIVSDTCSALDYAHNFEGPDGTPLEIVHRDVSAQNIMLSTDGVVKVLDFGVAKAVGNLSRTRPSWLKGKALYMAPEQIEMRPIDRRSDIFSLGTLLYIMCTMHRPFRGESEYQVMMSIVNDQPPDPRKYNPEIPDKIVRVIGRALQKDPAARYQTAAEMRDDLESYLFDEGLRVEAAQLRDFLFEVLPRRKKKTTGAGRVPTRPIPSPIRPAENSLEAISFQWEDTSQDEPILLLPRTKAEPILLSKPKKKPATEPEIVLPQEQPRSAGNLSQVEPKQRQPVLSEPARSDASAQVEQQSMAAARAGGEPVGARGKRLLLAAGLIALGAVGAVVFAWIAWGRGGDKGVAEGVPAKQMTADARIASEEKDAGAPAARPAADAAVAEEVAAKVAERVTGGTGKASPGGSKKRKRPRRRSARHAWSAGARRSVEPTGQEEIEPVIELDDSSKPQGDAPTVEERPQQTAKSSQLADERSIQQSSAGPGGDKVGQRQTGAEGGGSGQQVVQPSRSDGGMRGPGRNEPEPAVRPASTGKTGTAGLPEGVKETSGKVTALARQAGGQGKEDDAKPVFLPATRVKARRIAGSEPEYPRIARQARIQATLVVKLSISADGRVTGMRFLKTHPAFEQAVREAVERWRFSPYLINGKPVPTYTVYKFVFRLD